MCPGSLPAPSHPAAAEGGNRAIALPAPCLSASQATDPVLMDTWDRDGVPAESGKIGWAKPQGSGLLKVLRLKQ